ncbi:MAG: glycoside hydrolase family 15 protein [Planctomycetes bacterium]|nr:glycoside hydrolase family 15 protein [Planctomycetota bacterium]MCW8137467.1 glycoside hydrolase family 15 protein [Planctomycetota bacterium]
MRDEAGYLDIADYAVIGDGRTVALVGRDGSIDWACFPRFDAPAVFCRLLDARQGGSFQVAPTARWTSTRRYRPGTHVLETTFETANGRVCVTDALVQGGRPRIVRALRGISGEVELHIVFRPTFDFARHPTVWTRLDEGVVVAAGNDERLVLHTPAALCLDDIAGARGALRVRAGRQEALVLTHAAATDPDLAASAAEALDAIDAEEDRWRTWCSRIEYGGPHRDLVLRSALVLKLLAHEATGALVAAPTTSLPEELGGARNWDYRYTWLRDAALVLDALMSLGLHGEAMAFWRWLESSCLGCRGPVRIMYELDGSDVPREELLLHLDGYRGSRPVRIGNAAFDQEQLDVNGHVLDAAWVCQVRMAEPHTSIAPLLARLADDAAARWREPDRGIWEVRGAPRHFVHSKLMCWVALDRALRLAERGWLAGDLARWTAARTEVGDAILRDGFNARLGSFTQAFGSEVLDAAALNMSLVGFLPADDPRVVSTVERVQRELTSQGLVRRYTASDGLPGGEGAFTICSFWLVQALALQGRRDEAAALFERVLGCANDVGLLAEEIDASSGRLLGNFPQAYSHLALIRAALRLEGR